MSTEKMIRQKVPKPFALGDLRGPSGSSPYRGEWVRRAVRPRKRGAITVGAIVFFFLGTVALALFGLMRSSPPTPADELPLAQEGELRLPAGGELEVYYPVPYPRPPNLEI